MRSAKRLLSLLMAAIMLLGTFAFPVYAAEKKQEAILEFASYTDMLSYMYLHNGKPLGGNMLLVSGNDILDENIVGTNGIISVTPNGELEAAGAYSFTPNDTEYSKQSSVFSQASLSSLWNYADSYAANKGITPSTVKKLLRLQQT